jgi:hypothetical protein
LIVVQAKFLQLIAGQFRFYFLIEVFEAFVMEGTTTDSLAEITTLRSLTHRTQSFKILIIFFILGVSLFLLGRRGLFLLLRYIRNLILLLTLDIQSIILIFIFPQFPDPSAFSFILAGLGKGHGLFFLIAESVCDEDVLLFDLEPAGRFDDFY